MPANDYKYMEISLFILSLTEMDVLGRKSSNIRNILEEPINSMQLACALEVAEEKPVHCTIATARTRRERLSDTIPSNYRAGVWAKFATGKLWNPTPLLYTIWGEESLMAHLFASPFDISIFAATTQPSSTSHLDNHNHHCSLQLIRLITCNQDSITINDIVILSTIHVKVPFYTMSYSCDSITVCDDPQV